MGRSDAENETLPGTGHDALVAIERGGERDVSDNPWLRLSGIFADDPLLLPMLDAIYAARDVQRDGLDSTIAG